MSVDAASAAADALKSRTFVSYERSLDRRRGQKAPNPNDLVKTRSIAQSHLAQFILWSELNNEQVLVATTAAAAIRRLVLASLWSGYDGHLPQWVLDAESLPGRPLLT